VAEEVAKVAGGPEHVQGGFEWSDYHAGRDVIYTPLVHSRVYCIALRAQSHVGDAEHLAKKAVWGPFGPQTWIVAYQRSGC
jgi:hypothetical protein